VEIPTYQRFYLHSLDDLRAEISRLNVSFPTDEDLLPLSTSLLVAQTRVPNRFCAQPIAAGDATPSGTPSPLTHRRYRRLAEGRFGLIWLEMTAAGQVEKPGQLALNESTVSSFAALVREMRAATEIAPVIILQLTATDPQEFLSTGRLATEAGFDGIDLQCPREALPEVLAALRSQALDLLLAARLCVYEAKRGGFGVSASDYRRPDLTEPIRFLQQLHQQGLALLNITTASPILGGPHRGVEGRRDSEPADEHPLTVIGRHLHLAHALREAIPDLPVVTSGFSWLRQFIPQVAAGAIGAGALDFVGLGRAALAHPSLPTETFTRGALDPASQCMICGACARLRAEGEVVGCVLRDSATYGPVYRQMRRFDDDQLLSGAQRCHLCEAAPCIRAAPTRTDIPAFIQAFRQGDESRAYEIIHQRNPLPELTSQFSPAWLESEGACIETTLTGASVPILDLQLAIAARARQRGQTAIRLPTASSRHRVAVIGGGPTGLAATIRLLELGHAVDLYEQSSRLGGVPERLLASTRGISPQPEIDAILAPACAADRLDLHFGEALGHGLVLSDLLESHDAILVATGLWHERSLGHAPSVLDSLTFLESSLPFVPDRVAILAGGDSAMDAARLAQSRGAKEIFIIFGGPRSALHWHMPESWFATTGVQAMMNWQPLGYETESNGRVTIIRLRHTELSIETSLSVGLVIEAFGLEAAPTVSAALAEKSARVYTAGALVNGGASVSQCVADGCAIAATIHRDLSS
jgi:NADPH-dependent glutamate synthase beta subunit-like oxidoreductase/2,4-dienoyl-CoA reductase-like NADH-dependent reductase (Old Yellow Enzyme family)